MKRLSGFRKTANLPESVHQQLNMYAIAAGAAGVSLLASVQPTEAKIVYTPANIRIVRNQHYDLDVNHDGVTDFTLSNKFNFICGKTLCGSSTNVDVYPANGNGVVGHPPAALQAGIPIGRRNTFYGEGSMARRWHFCRVFRGCSTGSGGNWLNVGDRYLGLAFQIHGKIHYGWARLNVQRARGGFSAALTGYAYETASGKSLKAGQTQSKADDSTYKDFVPSASLTTPISDTPQPASLGMLAMGSPGLSIWRRKESLRDPSGNN